MKKQKKISVYEKNQLLKYDKSLSEFLEKGAMPIEYFTGFVDFFALELELNKNVLIPRVETEDLVDLLIKEFTNNYQNEEGFSYLEIGTGSGAISVAFLKQIEKKLSIKNNCRFLLTDVSPLATEIARENLKKHLSKNVTSNLKLIESHLTNGILDQKFDLIVANLPYIPSVNIEKLEESVKDYEPILALDGGKTGFELIAKLLDQILKKKLLAPQGKIFLEVDQSHNQAFIEKNFSRFLRSFKIEFIKDHFSRNRFLVIEGRKQ